MNCKEFNIRLAQTNDPGDLPEEMQRHINQCASCRHIYEQTRTLFDFVKIEKEAEVSPFVTTRVMAAIQNPEPSPWLVRPAVVSVMSGILLVLGFLAAGLTNQKIETTTQSTEIIASEYYFTENPGSELEEIWLNTYEYE